MEDTLAIIVVVAGVALAILAIRAQWRLYKKRQKFKAEMEELERKRQLEATRKWREGLMKSAVSNTKAVPTRTTTPAKKHTYTVSEPANTNDGFMDGVMTAMVINTLMDSGKSAIAGTVTKDEDTGSVGVRVNESSFGFDDDDSRKSASSTFSSSSWSSSDSYSSSSDSGPSSDW
jgi:hypothetical protein